MVLSEFRKAPLKAPMKAHWAVALMLGCAVAPAHAGWFSSDPKPAAKVEDKAAVKTEDKAPVPATNLEDSIRQAQMLRLTGLYPDAIKHLSQLMMVASDDGRVISEYGKTLAAMGRASDAVNFLTRAQQLQPGDWTIYSAIGVAYDQMGDQKSAQTAYEHALAIKPNEPSVLNNYALSRMLAKDPEMAGKLAARAESAGGMGEAKIARNIAMIRSLAPETHTVAQAPSPVPQASLATVAHAPVMARPLAPVAAAAPVAGNSVTKPQPQMAQVPSTASQAPAATQAPRPLQSKIVENLSVTALAKETPSKSATPVSPVKIGEADKTAPLARAVEAKPVPVKVEAPATVAKVTPTAPVKAAEARPAPVKTAEAPSVTLKMTPPAADAAKTVSAPKVLPPVNTADAKPASVKAAATKPKDTVPGLRMSANAY
jgi:Flp pilus assembly protein TadD